MIVLFQPGGTVKDKRITVMWNEKIPRAYNIPETEIKRADPDNPYLLYLVKPVGEVLPEDSPLLKDAPITEGTVLDLSTTEAPGNAFEHRDIIRMDDDASNDSKN